MSDKQANNTNLYFNDQRVCNHVTTNNGSVHIASYMEPAGSTPTTDRYTESQDDKLLSPLPHQETKDFFDYTCDYSDLSVLSGTKTDKRDDIPVEVKTPQGKQASEASPSLHKPAETSLQAHASVITPLAKTGLDSSNHARIRTDTIVAPETEDATAASRNKKPPMTDNANEGKETNPNENVSTSKNPKAHLIISKATTLYTSPFLDNEFKPSTESLEIQPELELLRPLILSQHEAFTQPIKDLGLVNLDLTKILEKKKESLRLLQQEKKIPRSLRIKCELTTSPAYTYNPVFQKLKANFQQKVSNFITDGTKIMTDWTVMNVQLLTIDRCSNILTKALQILDGLTFFHINVLSNPVWPSTEGKNIPLFLLKFYLSGKYFDIDEISKYLELPPEEILLIGTKIWTDNQSEDKATKLIESLKLSDINMNKHTDFAFVTEILLNFNQILKLTTIGIWQQHKETARQTTAAIKLKAKMKSMEILNATTSTAQAIAKATDSIDYNKILSANANLRIANLEKSFQKQEQKSNTIINQLKAKSLQKNSSGSHFSESMASPEKLTLQKKQSKSNMKRNMVDLTTEDTEEQYTEEEMLAQRAYHKKQKQRHHRQKNPRTPSRKAVQWKEGEVKNFHPHYPATELFSNQTTQNPFMMNSLAQKPPLFPMPPPPTSSPYYHHYQVQPNLPNHFPTHRQFLNPNQTQLDRQTSNPFNHLTKTSPFATPNFKNF
jgi:hypothetical protein